MKAAYLSVCVLLSVLSGCQTAPQAPLASNDFTFNASKTKTKEAIITTYLPRNYQIVKDSEFQLVMDRPANDNFMAQMVFGSKFNSVPNARLILTLVGDNPTHVHSQLQIITNPGSGFENAMSIDNNADGRATVCSIHGCGKNLLPKRNDKF